MQAFILTGPPGSGKNTIADILVKEMQPAAIVDVDSIRAIPKSEFAPWQGAEGQKLLKLGAENGCLLANNLIKNGYNVIILDVLTDETASTYKKLINQVRIVLLLPTLEETKRRNLLRSSKAILKDTEVELLYKWEENLTIYDEKIDNTNLSPDAVVTKLITNKE